MASLDFGVPNSSVPVVGKKCFGFGWIFFCFRKEALCHILGKFNLYFYIIRTKMQKSK